MHACTRACADTLVMIKVGGEGHAYMHAPQSSENWPGAKRMRTLVTAYLCNSEQLLPAHKHATCDGVLAIRQEAKRELASPSDDLHRINGSVGQGGQKGRARGEP